MLPKSATYADLCQRFAWDIPERYNIGWDICDKWAQADPDRVALILDEEDRTVSFAELRALSNQMANLLVSRGVVAGDRVGVLLPQQLETTIAHIAALKLGAVTIPLFTLFGEEALGHRLMDAGAKAIITNHEGADKIESLRDSLPALDIILNVDGGLHEAMAAEADEFHPRDTASDDPAILIYTSGTTGKPKGALHAHRVLLGHLPGVEMSHDLFPHVGDRMWTPADWAWIGGLLDVLMPALHHGIPVVVRRFRKFTGEAAFDLMKRRRVRNAFLPPTALKIMRGVSNPPELTLRTVASGGESLGAELLEWGQATLGVTINEFYGQTECNMVVSSAQSLCAHRSGVMGWPVPGHEVVVLNERAEPVRGEEGRIAVRRGSPVMFLGYWNNDNATREKFEQDWLITGDQGLLENDGAIRFVGRDDDVITSAGYRIGPGEIEDCLLKHSAVSLAGVVGKPDDLRGEIVKAYVVLTDGVDETDALADELKAFVKACLAAHEYPREIAFLPDLPMTTTGKIIRRELRERARNE
jgi:acetyl-CoA synthetase